MKLTEQQIQEIILEETKAVLREVQPLLAESSWAPVRLIARGWLITPPALQNLWKGGRKWAYSILKPGSEYADVIRRAGFDLDYLRDKNMREFAVFVENNLPKEQFAELIEVYNLVMGHSATQIKKLGTPFIKLMREDFVFLARVAKNSGSGSGGL